MKVQHGKDLANHSGPESCGDACEGAAEALTGETGGSAIEPRNQNSGDADAVKRCGRQNGPGRYMRVLGRSGAVGDPAHAGKFPAQKLGDLRRARRDDAGQFREGQEPHAWTTIGGEVGCARSTREAVEQGQPARGDGGGKERSQGERWTGPRTPDTVPDQLCVDGPGRRTSGSAPESAAAVHGAHASHHAAATCGQLL